MGEEKSGEDVLKTLRENNTKHGTVYLAKLPFANNGGKKAFSVKQKIRKFISRNIY